MKLRQHTIKENTSWGVKDKYVLRQLWMGSHMSVSYGDNFDTYEEAYDYLCKHYANRVNDYAIVLVKGVFNVRNELIVDKDTPRKKYAIFGKTRDGTTRTLQYCGVIEAYDRIEVSQKVSPNWGSKRQMVALQLNNKGKLDRKKFDEIINGRVINDNYKNQNIFSFYQGGRLEIELPQIL